MLNAVLAGKKRGTGLEGQQLALGQAEGAEDVITATVFERLAYLPDDLFSAIFSDLLGKPFGALAEPPEFWPSWYLEDGTRVEPDLLLSDGQRSLLIEAKRHDHARQQYAGQLAAELLSGWRMDKLEENCTLLTLGGMNDISPAAQRQLREEIIQALPAGVNPCFRLVCRSWQQLYQTAESHIDAQQTPCIKRLLDDLARAYAWHGLRTHRMIWMKDLQPASIHARPGAFDKWSLQWINN